METKTKKSRDRDVTQPKTLEIKVSLEMPQGEPERGQPKNIRRLSIDLPESWHRRFKTACARTDRKMLAEVLEFIERRTVELEEQ